MEDNSKKIHLKIIANLIVSFSVILLIIFLLPKLILFFMPLIIAWIVAMLANPLIHFLEQKVKIMRKHGTALIIVLIIALLSFLIYILLVAVINQAVSLSHDFPSIYNTVVNNIQSILTKMHKRIHFLPDDLGQLLGSGSGIINNFIKNTFGGAKSGAVSTVIHFSSSIADFLIMAILTILASYFMTVEKENISAFIKRNTPKEFSKYVTLTKQIISKAFVGYFVAHFKIMGIIFVITSIPYFFLGIKHFIFIAVITAIVDFLPFFGTGTILIPWAVYELCMGNFVYAAVLSILYVVTIIVRQFLEPKLIGDSVGLSPFATVIFMLIGYKLGGMLGLILAIPVGMFVVIFYKEGMFDQQIRGLKILIHDLYEYIHF